MLEPTDKMLPSGSTLNKNSMQIANTTLLARTISCEFCNFCLTTAFAIPKQRLRREMSENEESEDARRFKWPKSLCECLISEWKKYKCLYNPNHKDFMNRDKRLQCFKEITKTIRRENSEITIDEVKQRIYSLRIQYVRELKKIETKKALGEPYVPRLWCFPLLSFIERADYNKPKEPAVAAQTSVIKTNCPSQKNALINHLVNVKVIAAQRSQKKYVWLGKQVATDLSRLTNEDLQDEAVWRIQKVLRYYSRKDQISKTDEACTNPPSPES